MEALWQFVIICVYLLKRSTCTKTLCQYIYELIIILVVVTIFVCLSAFAATLRKQNWIWLRGQPRQWRWRWRWWIRRCVWPQLSAKRAFEPQFIQVMTQSWADTTAKSDSSSPQSRLPRVNLHVVAVCVALPLNLAPHSVWTLLYGPNFLKAALDLFRVFMFKIVIWFQMPSSLSSWCLMRLAMVQLVLVNLKSFYPMAGYDLLGKHWNTTRTLWCTNLQNVDKCRHISHCLSYLILLPSCLCVYVPASV